MLSESAPGAMCLFIWADVESVGSTAICIRSLGFTVILEKNYYIFKSKIEMEVYNEINLFISSGVNSQSLLALLVLS